MERLGGPELKAMVAEAKRGDQVADGERSRSPGCAVSGPVHVTNTVWKS
ncbi:MAG: hypothetical protein HHJ12_08840 [Glaciimonas sp.]|nr:hypothetical protein [Glaciimonas sp.]